LGVPEALVVCKINYKKYKNMTVSNYVFNLDKTQEQYSKTGLFFGGRQGVFDTVNKQYPEIWALYKEMKSLDWDESEVDYSQCNSDFKNCPIEVSDMMIRTLAWQWEADSVASRSVAPLFAPFISSSELWAAWQRISDNEVIHAAAYSEIVRMSFDNPSEVLADVLCIKESVTRLETVAKSFEDLYIASHKYALDLIDSDQETYNTLYKGIIALLLLERIQFMSSFAITFTIVDSGWFQPIGAIVNLFKVFLMCYKNVLTNYLKIFMHNYPSDISRAQFAIILPILESSCKTTSPRTVDLYLYWGRLWESAGNYVKGLTTRKNR
jgi:ribonucleotide reductase beta subunit family protein with ferritin-like domain